MGQARDPRLTHRSGLDRQSPRTRRGARGTPELKVLHSCGGQDGAPGLGSSGAISLVRHPMWTGGALTSTGPRSAPVASGHPLVRPRSSRLAHPNPTRPPHPAPTPQARRQGRCRWSPACTKHEAVGERPPSDPPRPNRPRPARFTGRPHLGPPETVDGVDSPPLARPSLHLRSSCTGTIPFSGVLSLKPSPRSRLYP